MLRKVSSMNSIEDEIRIWNTPLVSAYFLWRFVRGYVNEHAEHAAPSVVLCVIALTIMSDENLYAPINPKKAKLSSYVYSFVKDKKSDALVTIHQLISESKFLCIDAIDMATATGVVVWDADHAALMPGDFEDAEPECVGKKHKANGDKAELLGKWFAQLEVNQITTLLGVSL